MKKKINVVCGVCVCVCVCVYLSLSVGQRVTFENCLSSTMDPMDKVHFARSTDRCCHPLNHLASFWGIFSFVLDVDVIFAFII